MLYNFDAVIDRRNTCSIKHDFNHAFGKPDDVIPLWVADMDFKTADVIINALEHKLSHGVLGYSTIDDSYFEVLENWFNKRFNWQISKDWLVTTPTIVFALYMSVRAFTSPGDAVMLQQPVYPPFKNAITDNGRKPIVNPLKAVETGYEIDFEDFESKIIENGVKLFILCSPHNPVGRVWRADELKRMGEICVKHKVRIVADEIHADFTNPGHIHSVFTALDPTFNDYTITCTSPTKSFNLAGLQISNIFIPNPNLRQSFEREIALTGHKMPNIMAVEACKAAYAKGENWLEALRNYIYENALYVDAYLKANMPQIKATPLEGTYLMWLDFSALEMDDPALETFLLTQAKLWLNAGVSFGAGGENHMRLNIACPRSILTTALNQMQDALQNLSL